MVGVPQGDLRRTRAGSRHRVVILHLVPHIQRHSMVPMVEARVCARHSRSGPVVCSYACHDLVREALLWCIDCICQADVILLDCIHQAAVLCVHCLLVPTMRPMQLRCRRLQTDTDTHTSVWCVRHTRGGNKEKRKQAGAHTSSWRVAATLAATRWLPASLRSRAASASASAARSAEAAASRCTGMMSVDGYTEQSVCYVLHSP